MSLLLADRTTRRQVDTRTDGRLVVRRKRKDRVDVRRRSKDLFFRVYVLMAALSCGLAGVILEGGSIRFSGPGFRGPRELVSWLPFFEPHFYWGVLFMLHGIALVVCVYRPLAKHVLRFGLVVYSFLSLTFLLSVFKEPTVAATGCVAYLGLGTLCLLLSDHLEQYGWEE